MKIFYTILIIIFILFGVVSSYLFIYPRIDIQNDKTRFMNYYIDTSKYIFKFSNNQQSLIISKNSNENLEVDFTIFNPQQKNLFLDNWRELRTENEIRLLPKENCNYLQIIVHPSESLSIKGLNCVDKILKI